MPYKIPSDMSFSDRQQLREYGKLVKYLSTGEYLQTKAIQYVREDREIQDINYHLNSLVCPEPRV